MAKVKVTRNYQVTLPEEVRKAMEIREGEFVEIVQVDRQRALLRRIVPVEKLAGAWDEEMDRTMAEVRNLWRRWRL
jgi:AbrB family looped-hinge helix DNA binding protein